MVPDAAGAPPEETPAVARRISFFTFGCRLNQCETAGLRAQFSAPDYALVPFDAEADVCVVNTCSVTGRADAQARQLVRRLIRERPGRHVVVTGCYAQRAPRELAAIPGVSLVAGNGEKDRLRGLVDALPIAPPTTGADVAVSDLRKVRRSFEMAPVEFGERTRAYLRVQDGCDAGCSFCIIPRLRGRSTSLAADDAVRRVERIVAEGYREITLTGIHLGMFGHERGETSALAALIDRLEALPGDFRLRLSSIEPQEIDDALIERLAAGRRLVPHLHVPLQSGSDRTLLAMNRTYASRDYRRVVERLAARLDILGLGADVIVGFPGETDDDFAATEAFIRELPFTYLHVFPFSPRPGTRAATLPNRPGGERVDARGLRLRQLSEEKGEAFRRRLIGRRLRVLVEEPDGGDGWSGLCEHFARVRLPWADQQDLTGRFVTVRAERTSDSLLYGIPLAP